MRKSDKVVTKSHKLTEKGHINWQINQKLSQTCEKSHKMWETIEN